MGFKRAQKSLCRVEGYILKLLQTIKGAAALCILGHFEKLILDAIILDASKQLKRHYQGWYY